MLKKEALIDEAKNNLTVTKRIAIGAGVVAAIGLVSAFATIFDFVFNKVQGAPDTSHQELLNNFKEVKDELSRIQHRLQDIEFLIKEQGVRTSLNPVQSYFDIKIAKL